MQETPVQIPGLGRSAGEGIGYPLQYSWASLVTQVVKNQPAMQDTWVRSLGWEDPLENGKATHSSILAWRTPWTTKSQTRLSDFQFHFPALYSRVLLFIHPMYNSLHLLSPNSQSIPPQPPAPPGNHKSKNWVFLIKNCPVPAPSHRGGSGFVKSRGGLSVLYLWYPVPVPLYITDPRYIM